MQSNVLPEEVYAYAYESGQGQGQKRRSGVAPSLVGAKRSFERERVKDRLRGWLERREGYESRNVRERGREREERRSVRDLVRRFRAWAGDEDGAARGLGAKKQSDWQWECRHKTDGEHLHVKAPTRTKVLGLRRFWEGLASGTT